MVEMPDLANVPPEAMAKMREMMSKMTGQLGGILPTVAPKIKWETFETKTTGEVLAHLAGAGAMSASLAYNPESKTFIVLYSVVESI